jgi:hypothetical protein
VVVVERHTHQDGRQHGDKHLPGLPCPFADDSQLTGCWDRLHLGITTKWPKTRNPIATLVRSRHVLTVLAFSQSVKKSTGIIDPIEPGRLVPFGRP